MKKALLYTVVVTYCCFSFSQTASITGKVVDEANNPIAFANVLLLNATDSTFVKGASATELGLFQLEDISHKTYLLQASYIGRISPMFFLEINGDMKAGPLVIDMDAVELDEVVVSTTQPKIERLQDRLVFNVENTVVSQGDSWGILRNTPGVIVSGNELQIRGSSATVYLNNRKVQISGEELKILLEGFSGNNIKSIEVIANPPANYDAEGGPVLNIITNKAITPGYKGSVNGTLTKAVFSKYSLGTSHYFKTEKLDIFANYSVNPRQDLTKTVKGINFINDQDQTFSDWDTNNELIKKSTPHNATAIVDYSFDEANSLNFTTTYLNNPNQGQNLALETLIRNEQGALDSTFSTNSVIDMDNTNLALDFTFDHNFKKSGSKISLNVHYTDFDYAFNQGITTDYFDTQGDFIRGFGFETVSNQDINIYTAQLDYSLPTESGSFETGVKASRIDSESTVDYQNFEGIDESINANLADDFLYDETVYAGYISLVQSWPKLSLKAGLRGEYTKAFGSSLNLGEVNNQEFFELFPSVNLLYPFAEKHSFTLTYNRGIDRPNYNDLNPFRLFINENDFEEGNAELKPSFGNNFNFNYSFNDELFFDFYYRDNGELIDNLVFQDNASLTLRELRQNLLGSTSYGLDITFSKSILSYWYAYAYVSLFHEDVEFLAVESGAIPFENAVDGVYAYLANYLTLSSDGTFTGEVGLTYFSKFLFGSYIQDEQLNLTLGLRKSLWNNRAVLSVAAEDLLEQYVPNYTSKYLNQDNFYRRRPETQFVRVGFTYNFGNFRLDDNERGLSKKERDRLEAED